MAGFDRTGCRFGHISSPKRPLFAPPPPPPPKQMACRVCKSVFLSAQSLIDHMGTHLVEQTTTPPSAPLPRHKPYDFHSLKPTTRSPSSCNHFLFDISTPTRLITTTTSLCPPFFTHQIGLREDIINPNSLNTTSSIIPPPQISTGCTQPLQFPSLLGVKRHLTAAMLPQKQRKMIRNTKSDVKQLENPFCDIRKGSKANNEGISELETLDLNLKL